MNDTIDLLSRRRSVPPLTMAGPGPDAGELETILRLASRVPDHGKLAPWRFIVFEGDARVRAGEALAAIYRQDKPDAKEELVKFEANRLARAPMVVAVVSKAAPHAKIPEWEQIMSAGAACANLVIAANALGFATAWLTEWYAYDRRALAALGVVENENVAGFIHIGRTDRKPEDRERPALTDIVTRFEA